MAVGPGDSPARVPRREEPGPQALVCLRRRRDAAPLHRHGRCRRGPERRGASGGSGAPARRSDRAPDPGKVARDGEGGRPGTRARKGRGPRASAVPRGGDRPSSRRAGQASDRRVVLHPAAEHPRPRRRADERGRQPTSEDLAAPIRGCRREGRLARGPFPEGSGWIRVLGGAPGGHGDLQSGRQRSGSSFPSTPRIRERPLHREGGALSRALAARLARRAAGGRPEQQGLRGVAADLHPAGRGTPRIHAGGISRRVPFGR